MRSSMDLQAQTVPVGDSGLGAMSTMGGQVDGRDSHKLSSPTESSSVSSVPSATQDKSDEMNGVETSSPASSFSSTLSDPPPSYSAEWAGNVKVQSPSQLEANGFARRCRSRARSASSSEQHGHERCIAWKDWTVENGSVEDCKLENTGAISTRRRSSSDALKEQVEAAANGVHGTAADQDFSSSSADVHTLKQQVEVLGHELVKANSDISSLRKRLHSCQEALARTEQASGEDRAQLVSARQELITYQHTLQSSQGALAVQHRVTRALREEASTVQTFLDAEKRRTTAQANTILQLREELNRVRQEQQLQREREVRSREREVRSPAKSPIELTSPQHERRIWRQSPPTASHVQMEGRRQDDGAFSAPPPLTSIQPKAEPGSHELLSPRLPLTPNALPSDQFQVQSGRWHPDLVVGRSRASSEGYHSSSTMADSPTDSRASAQIVKNRRKDLEQLQLVQNTGHVALADTAQMPISRYEKVIIAPDVAKLRPYLEQWLQKTDEAARRTIEQPSPLLMRSPMITSPPPHSPAFVSTSPAAQSALHVVRTIPHYSETSPHHRPIAPHPSHQPQHHPPGTMAMPAMRKRKRRLVLEPETRAILEQQFAVRPKPSPDELVQLAQQLDLEKEEVRVWFCNRRQKEKRLSTLGSPMRFSWPPAHPNDSQSSPGIRQLPVIAPRPVAASAMASISPGLPVLDSVPSQRNSSSSPDSQKSPVAGESCLSPTAAQHKSSPEQLTS